MKKIKKRVVIIDNQYVQYSRLSKTFKNDSYEFFPEIGMFKEFMDKIKVIIDSRYQQKYREGCLSDIKAYINECNPDVIVIDYVLGGAHLCETGVDLAIKIVDGKIPVLFVSIENRNNKTINAKLEEYKWLYDWSEKERFQWYGNTENVDEDYYSLNIIKNANQLIDRYRKIMKECSNILENLNKLQFRDIYKKNNNPYILDGIKDGIDYIVNNRQIPNSISDSEIGEISRLLYSAFQEKYDSFGDNLRRLSLFRDKLIIDAKNA